jgi:hypothetical protein
VIAEIDAEYTDRVNGIIDSVSHDYLDLSGTRAWWKHVLAVYTVKTGSDPNNPMVVAIVDDEKAALLRRVFWDMNTVSYWVETIVHVEYYSMIDFDGAVWWGSHTWYEYVLHITASRKMPEEMAELYGFSDVQREWLAELLKPDYNSLWNAVLYGIGSSGGGSMLEVAGAQLGNVGGGPYWRWYGFESRVGWCAIFVSWAADQCGYIDAGIIPLFSSCDAGIQWFKDRSQWQDAGYTPAPGDIVFFDWLPDGICDHVGIVEYVEGEYIHTIEGNTSDSVARRSYWLNSLCIVGYGTPAY